MKINFIHSSIIVSLLIFSCSKDETKFDQMNEESLDVKTSYVHYKNNTYTVEYIINEFGEEEPISEIPEELNILSEKENLALLSRGKDLFAFDNIEEQEIFLNNENPIESRSSKDLAQLSTVDLFTKNIHIYEHKDFGGAKLKIQNMSQLNNLKSANFNDKMSSIFIDKDLGRSVTFYWHADFKGRSITIDNYHDSVTHPTYGDGYGKKNLKNIVFGTFCTSWWYNSCNNYNDELSSIKINSYYYPFLNLTLKK